MAKYRSVGKKLLRHKGFTFPQGQISMNQISMAEISAAVFGDREPSTFENVDDAVRKFESTVISLFHCLIDRADVYCALRGHEAFYSTLAHEFPSDGDFSSEVIKTLEETFIQARKDYQGQQVFDTGLTSAVDGWIEIKDSVAALPGLHTFSLAAHPTEMGSISSQLQGINMGAESHWPPAHFTPNDVAIISMKCLRPLLFGKTTQTPGSHPPLPNKHSTPTEIRGFLCAIALANYEQQSTWKLALTPVAQFDNTRERRDWAAATAGESRLCFTVANYMTNAIDALQSGKTASVALATPWFGRPWGAVPSIDDVPNAAGHTQQELWSSMCPRLGFGIVLHRYADGIEFILFDPIRCYAHIRNDPYVKANQVKIFAFRQLIRQYTEEAVTALGGRLVRVWWGGKLDVAAGAGAGADGVELASEWVRQLVSAGRSLQDPFALDDSDWRACGFEAMQL